MGEVTRNIGLSLGADICWPLCFEHMMKRLDLRIPHAGDTVRFEARELWGEDTTASVVHVDAWEPYLEPIAAEPGR